jgi:NAD(P)-dependent dehydrogenase (short-subunit alcohol dehydrogenase family)
MRLANKTAIITGGSSGIGLAAAKLFVREGARVAVTGRNPDKLAAAIDQLGGKAIALRVDVTDTPALESTVSEAAEKLGGLDIVYANAGIGGASPFGKTSPEDWDKIVNIDLKAVFFTFQAALPHLREGSSLIACGSGHEKLGIPGWSAYAASKGGMRSMVRNLASELAPRRIRVNQVTPGIIRTPLWETVNGAGALDRMESTLAKGIPVGRIGEAEEIAYAVLYLASDESSFTTGTDLVVDGGQTDAPRGAPIYRT